MSETTLAVVRFLLVFGGLALAVVLYRGWRAEPETPRKGKRNMAIAMAVIPPLLGLMLALNLKPALPENPIPFTGARLSAELSAEKLAAVQDYAHSLSPYLLKNVDFSQNVANAKVDMSLMTPYGDVEPTGMQQPVLKDSDLNIYLDEASSHLKKSMQAHDRMIAHARGELVLSDAEVGQLYGDFNQHMAEVFGNMFRLYFALGYTETDIAMVEAKDRPDTFRLHPGAKPHRIVMVNFENAFAAQPES